MRLVLGAFLACALLTSGSARATSLAVEMHFDDPGWTGSFVYDDSTRVSYHDAYFGYTLDSFTITWQGITWDESDIFQVNTSNVVEDSYGKVVFYESVEDVASGAIISGNYSVLVLPRYDIQQSWLAFSTDCPPNCSSPDFYYTTSLVPEPGSLELLGLGLVGLLLARRARARGRRATSQKWRAERPRRSLGFQASPVPAGAPDGLGTGGRARFEASGAAWTAMEGDRR